MRIGLKCRSVGRTIPTTVTVYLASYLSVNAKVIIVLHGII